MIWTVIGFIAGALALLLVGFVLGVIYRKKVSEREISSAEDEAKRIINEGIKTAENKKREALLEAKEETHRLRSECDREIKERRNEVQKQERRLQQKEENLDRKTDSLEKKTENLNRKLQEADAQLEEARMVKKSQLEMLEKISGYTADEAKQYLIQSLETEVTHEMAAKLKEVEAQFKEEAETKAREYITTAIQRCAADHTSEVTVSVVPLPNDEMKGRIIGREGRNIRSIETLTGFDLIIDDTPEAITLSSFDPVRREVARIALEKLIQDGRIHPARIEEMVAKAQKEVNQSIKEAGEQAVFEINLHGIHPDIVKLLGRMKYRTSYGQNVLNHSIEVAHIAGLLASDPSVWIWPASTRNPRKSSMPSRRTTTTWSPTRSSPASSRRRTPSARPVRERGARTSRTTSSVLKSWRPFPGPSRASTAATRSRPAVRSASWSSRTRSARIR